MIQLSPRLQKVADLLPKQGVFADIGSDHAYLPIYMVQHFPGLQAIAGEVVQGPYQAACSSVRKYGMTDRIQCRLGNGLSIVMPNEVQAVSICGMGGVTITEILDQSPQVVKTIATFVLQPNTHADRVRAWAVSNGYTIDQEDLIEDSGVIYDVLRLQRGAAESLSPLELFFGRWNIKRNHPLLKERIEEELSRTNRVLTQLGRAVHSQEIEQKIQEMRSWLQQIQGLQESVRCNLAQESLNGNSSRGEDHGES